MEVILTEYDIYQHIYEQNLINSYLSDLYSSMQLLYGVELSDGDKTKLKLTYLKMKMYRKRKYDKRQKVDWEEIVRSGSNDVDVLKVVVEDEVADEVVRDEKEALEDSFQLELINGYKPFPSLDKKQQLRRINQLLKVFQVTADHFGISEELLLELLEGKVRKEKKKDEVPLITALSVYQECELGRRRYTKQKKLLKSAGFDILPSYKKLNKFKQQRLPKIQILPEPYVGVYVDLEEAVLLSVQQLMKTGQVKISDADAVLSMKYGFDGSGSHNMYNQKGNAQTNNILLSTFCPLSIKENGEVVWQESTPNSATTQRPYCLQMGKESSDQYKIQDRFQTSILNMEQEGIEFGEGKLLKLKATLSCDSKASEIVFGNGGAFCDLCPLTKEECEDVQNITDGFEITKSVQELWEIYENLKDDNDENEVRKRPGDYNERQGMCHKPTIRHETHSYQILHARLQTFDTFMEAMVRAYGGMNYWGNKNPHSKPIYANFKKQLQAFILDNTGIHWDYPNSQGGTSTTGKTAKDLLECFLSEIVSLLREADQRRFDFFGTELASILRTLNSKDYVNVENYRSVCIGLYVFLRNELPWMSITPTMHKLLGHTWELIEMNNGNGLGAFNESGLEACNKLLRRFRTNLGRKTSQIENLTDTFVRCWLNCDGEVNQQRQLTLPWCKMCKVRGHSTRYCEFKFTTQGPLKRIDALVKHMKTEPKH